MSAIFCCDDYLIEIKQIIWPVLIGGKITIHGAETTINGGEFVSLGDNVSFHVFVFEKNVTEKDQTNSYAFKGMYHLNETEENLNQLADLVQSKSQDAQSILGHVLKNNPNIEDFFIEKMGVICEKVLLNAKLDAQMPIQGSTRKAKI